MPAKNQKSADPVNAEEDMTSDMSIRSASKPVMGSENEPMFDASVEYKHTVNAEVGGGAELTRGELVSFSTMETEEELEAMCIKRHRTRPRWNYTIMPRT